MLKTFALAALVAFAFSCAACSGQTFDIVQERNGIVNVFARLKQGKPTTIAYFGGSITAGAGASDSARTSWRALTSAWFRRQYPRVEITDVDAAIGGTGSDFGAFRLKRDVLDKHPNLVFVEFAVNDSGTPPSIVNRAMEGIVRHIRSADPTTEICFIYTLSQSMLPDYKQGKLPSTCFLHDVIAAHYRISSVNVGAAAAEQLNSGNLRWTDFSKDVCHPTDAGYALYADTITAFLAQQTLHISRLPVPYRLVEPLDPRSWSNGAMSPPSALTSIGRGWIADAAQPDRGWPPLITAKEPTAEPLEFKFTGDIIGICFVLGPDTGNLDYRVDNGDWQALRPFDVFALDGPRIQSRTLADSLSFGAHTLCVRPRTDKDDRSKGTITRLAFFMTNEPLRP
jgi:lysophospholipase L1-like esterase